MDISLIIFAYSVPMALDLCLESTARLSVKPDEVVVADDRLDDVTTKVTRHWELKLAMPVKHICQENNGFRLAEKRKFVDRDNEKKIICAECGIEQHIRAYNLLDTD